MAGARREEWKAPPPRRLRTILERLRAEYGRPVTEPHRAPIDELVLTVLSQNTNDRNRDVAYERLRERFASWHDVRGAPLEEVEEAIRPGGLAVTKAPRIQAILRAIGDDDLSRLEHEPLAAARAELCTLLGVGRKTAACVLLFSYALPDVPVDTHVHRVGLRLGLFRPGAPLDEAHDEMLRLAQGSDPYEAHTALIRHGRRTCSARSPRCGECPLRRMCPWAREHRPAVTRG
ncbi:endonuclease III [soil metagenome]